MNSAIRPKKHLGQHFLADKNMARKIAGCVQGHSGNLLEIGAGTGSLTRYLQDEWNGRLWVIEVDKEAVEYLHQNFPGLSGRIIENDILTHNLNLCFHGGEFRIIGNFPYNISSQILFKVLEYRSQVTEVVGMFQKEVAKRICSPPGNKDYGILSVLLQAYYEMEYLFDVPPSVFVPSPRVHSGVVRLTRKPGVKMECDENLFAAIVKKGFNQRRKKLSNALKGIIAGRTLKSRYLDLRAEQLSWNDFAELTRCLEKG